MSVEAIKAALRHRRAKGLDVDQIIGGAEPIGEPDSKDSDLAPDADEEEGTLADTLDDKGIAADPTEEDQTHDPVVLSEEHEMNGHPELQHAEMKAAVADKEGAPAIQHAKVKEALVRHGGAPTSLAAKVRSKIQADK